MAAIYSLIYYFGNNGRRRVQPRNPATERLLDMLKQVHQCIKGDSLTKILSSYGSYFH